MEDSLLVAVVEAPCNPDEDPHSGKDVLPGPLPCGNPIPETPSIEKLENSVAFLEETTGFSPDMVVMDGTPRFEKTEQWEVESIRKLAAGWGAEVWTSAILHREGQELDDRQVPAEVARYEDDIGVIVHLLPESDHVKVRITKEHQSAEVAQVQMELDPRTLLLRWR